MEIPVSTLFANILLIGVAGAVFMGVFILGMFAVDQFLDLYKRIKNFNW